MGVGDHVTSHSPVPLNTTALSDAGGNQSAKLGLPPGVKLPLNANPPLQCWWYFRSGSRREGNSAAGESNSEAVGWIGPLSPHTLLGQYGAGLIGESDHVWNPHFGLVDPETREERQDQPMCFQYNEVSEALGGEDNWHGMPEEMVDGPRVAMAAEEAAEEATVPAEGAGSATESAEYESADEAPSEAAVEEALESPAAESLALVLVDVDDAFQGSQEAWSRKEVTGVGEGHLLGDECIGSQGGGVEQGTGTPPVLDQDPDKVCNGQRGGSERVLSGHHSQSESGRGGGQVRSVDEEEENQRETREQEDLMARMKVQHQQEMKELKLLFHKAQSADGSGENAKSCRMC
jgi:hypothetical protein